MPVIVVYSRDLATEYRHPRPPIVEFRARDYRHLINVHRITGRKRRVHYDPQVHGQRHVPLEPETEELGKVSVVDRLSVDFQSI